MLARLDGRTEHFSVQNLSNLLLSAAVLQRRCISPAALNDAVAAIAGRGNRQEVGVPPAALMPTAHRKDAKQCVLSDDCLLTDGRCKCRF